MCRQTCHNVWKSDDSLVELLLSFFQVGLRIKLSSKCFNCCTILRDLPCFLKSTYNVTYVKALFFFMTEKFCCSFSRLLLPVTDSALGL